MRGDDGRVAPYSIMVLVVVLFALVGIGATAQRNNAQKNQAQTANGVGGSPTHSTTIALTSDETRVVVVNREANSVSIIQVKDTNGNDVANKLAEIAVGQEPRCVAVHPTDRAAYVTNGISGTVSVVDLVLGREVQQIQVGTEPRGCALTPDGSLLYVANHTEGTVSILVTSNPLNPILDGAVQVGGRPTAIAITDKGTGNIHTRSSSPRSSPNSTPTSKTPLSTAMVRRAISENKGSSTPSRRAMPIRRSPKSP